jgi:hypothetical protein
VAFIGVAKHVLREGEQRPLPLAEPVAMPAADD